MRGLAKSMYEAARLVSVEGDTAVVEATNENHRANIERKRGDAEAALSTVLGRPLRIRLVAGAESFPEGPTRSGPADDEPSGTDEDPLGGADVHELEDAPDAPSSGIDALTEAFPGSQLIEER